MDVREIQVSRVQQHIVLLDNHRRWDTEANSLLEIKKILTPYQHGQFRDMIKKQMERGGRNREMMHGMHGN